MSDRRLLVVIPARGGSRGIPGKNRRLLAGRPLLAYTLDCARAVADDADICLTTDDPAIRQLAEDRLGLAVPFLRPDRLATDTAGMHEVLLHALDHYAEQGRSYDDLLLLQPTSPLRRPDQVRAALTTYYRQRPELLVSVREASANPYYNLYEEDGAGRLQLSKPGNFVRRQDCPPVYELNGAIYVTATATLRERPLHAMTHRIKFVMSCATSHDLDTPDDWNYVSYLLGQAGGDDDER